MKGYSLLKKGLVTLTSVFYLSSATLTWADDTDIYLHNPNLDSSVKPNVMFILDNSGSMSNEVSGDDSRMDVMQKAFADIMQHSSNLNVGLMKMNRRDGESSRLVYPVTDIDKVLDDSIIIEGTPSIETSADDAYEVTTSGQVVLDSTTLPIGKYNSGVPSRAAMGNSTSTIKNSKDNPEGLKNDKWWYNGEEMNFNGGQINALMFRNLSIPANATITEAYITFVAADDNENNARILVSAELSKQPQSFDNKKYKSRKRTKTESWKPSPWKDKDKRYSTQPGLDLKAIIQEVLDSDKINWSQGEKLNSLALFFESVEGRRDAYKITTKGTQTEKAAKIYIEYEVNDLPPEPILTGLRFQNVGIPQGATVTSASLEFTAAEDSDNSLMTVKIRAADPGSDANRPFTEAGFDLSTRGAKNALTAIFRDIEPWLEGTGDNPNTYSVDIQELVQSLVKHNKWCGNDVATFFLSASSGFRRAHSFDGNNGLKPRLKIKYTGGKDGCKNEIYQKRIAQGSHDAFQNDKIRDRENYLFVGQSNSNNTTIGLHYPRFPIKQGAKILSATLEMTAWKDQPAEGAQFKIQADDVDNSSQ